MTNVIELATPDDMLVHEGESLLLYGHELLRLSPVPTAIAQACRMPVVLDDLAAQLAALFGTPEGQTPQEATRRIVEELRERGVVTVTTTEP